MSGSLLIDTHIALWLDSKDERLRPGTRKLIDECWREEGTIFLSAVSAWEIALLFDRGRFGLDIPPYQWVQRFLGVTGVASAPLTPSAAARSDQLDNLHHRDPADRLLFSTAIELGCPLVTYDSPIIDFANTGGRRYGFSVAA